MSQARSACRRKKVPKEEGIFRRMDFENNLPPIPRMITSSRYLTLTNSKYATFLGEAYSTFENGEILQRFDV